MFNIIFSKLTLEKFSLKLLTVLSTEIDMRALADDERILVEVRIAGQSVGACWCDMRPLESVPHGFDWVVDCRVFSDVVDVLPRSSQNQSAFDFTLVRIWNAVECPTGGAFREHAVMERLLRQHLI